MKPRYSIGKGTPPRHVADFQQRGRRACLILRDQLGIESTLEAEGHDELRLHLEKLMGERVPFSVGGMCPGPAEALHHWFRERGVIPEYLEISWQGPGAWIVREIVDGATEWEEVSLGVLLANHSPQARRP